MATSKLKRGRKPERDRSDWTTIQVLKPTVKLLDELKKKSNRPKYVIIDDLIVKALKEGYE